MKRTEKEQIIAEVAEIAGRAHGMFFTDFSGLTVEQATELRRELRKSGIDYRVAKNTLIRKALEKVGGYDGVFDKLAGPTGVAFSYDDPAAPAKVIQKFAEKHKKLSLKVCVIEREVYDGARLDEIARIPSRAELVAGILGSLQSPMAGVPNVVHAVIRELVSVIDEIGKKKAA
ncbi:MAG: 50S ribosomal protein L10 [Bacteroidetes bacterium]|nr:50S ribosomal protein L10 [Bacteroidota bacterium]